MIKPMHFYITHCTRGRAGSTQRHRLFKPAERNDTRLAPGAGGGAALLSAVTHAVVHAILRARCRVGGGWTSAVFF